MTGGAIQAGRNRIAILPFGAHEQHGPHLPFETDTIIATGIAERLVARVGDKLDLDLLPTEPIGYSVEHLDFPGTESLGYGQAVEKWLAIAGDVKKQGIGKLLLLNAHGDNSPLLTLVATEARIRFGMLVVATSWSRFGLPDGLMPAEQKAVDIHAGAIETSVMLALAPHLVARTKIADFPSRQSEFISLYKHLRAYGPHAFGWKMSDLNPDGAAGDATQASADKGEAILDHAVAGLAELLDDMARFPLEELR